MKTEIKDYLPLYLGCKFKHDSDVGTYELCGYNIYNDHVQNALGMDTYSSKGTRLILRKLSDMTEEEANSWFDFHYRNNGVFNWRNCFEVNKSQAEFWINYHTSKRDRRHVLKFNELDAYDFQYLLSKGFDLFNLIEQGLAIDKATLKAS